MPSVAVPFPLSSNPGRAPGEGSGRLVNCYALKDGDGPRWRPVPGLTPYAAPEDGDIRGLFYDGESVLAIIGSAAFTIDQTGTLSQLEGSVPGDGPVTIARNNSSPPTTMIVTSNGALIISSTGVVQPYPDGNLPVVNDVGFLDGYFLSTTASGQIWASDLNSTTVDALSFAQAEARLDGLYRGIVYGQQFFAMGSDTIEVSQDAGTQPYPLSRVAVIPTGLIGPWAVAGQQDGWAGPLIFVAQDGSVRRLDGYIPTRISNEDLEYLISGVTDKTQLRAAVYTFGGNAMWSLSSPDWTWEHNVTTGAWHERMSYGQGRWRGTATVKAVGQWLVADVNGGAIYTLDAGSRTEGGDPLVWGLDSGPTKAFPQRLVVSAAYLDFVLGQASVDDDDAAALISWSHDGGAKWSNPLMRSLGKPGYARGRVSVNRLGLSTPAGMRLRFRVSDPAYSSFAGAMVDAQGRR